MIHEQLKNNMLSVVATLPLAAGFLAEYDFAGTLKCHIEKKIFIAFVAFVTISSKF